MRIGQKLRQIRKLQKKTLLDVEAGTGINNGNLSKIERDALGMSEETLKKLADYYGVTISDLYSQVDATMIKPGIKELQSDAIVTFAAGDVPDNTIVTFSMVAPDKQSGTGWSPLLHQRMAVSIDQLRCFHRKPSSLIALSVSDDGMAAAITSRDHVLVDTNETEVPNAGGAFVFIFNNDFVVRKTYRKPSGDVLLVCDNKEFPEMTMTKSDMNQVRIVGKVIYRCGAYK